MTQDDFLRRLVDALNATGIPFMVTGSLASSYHGEPRSTFDVDIVVDPTADALLEFVDKIQSDCYADRTSATKALDSRAMFNIVDFSTGIKADLIIRKNRPFSEQEFARRIKVDLMGVEAFVTSAEDAILSKLEWAKLGQSERQYRDAVGVARVSADSLDLEYIRHWSGKLGVLELHDRLLRDLRIVE